MVFTSTTKTFTSKPNIQFVKVQWYSKITIFVSGCLQVEEMNKLKNLLHFYRVYRSNTSTAVMMSSKSPTIGDSEMKYSSSDHCCIPKVDSVSKEYNVYMTVCLPLSFVCIPLVVKRKHTYFNSNHNAISEISE